MEDKTTSTVDTQTVDTKTEETGKKDTGKIDYEAELKKLREENDKLKKAQTNASKDASEWKSKFRATQDEATRKAEEQQEALEKIMAENEALKKTQTLATHKAGWLGLGFNDELATEASEASVGGDFNALMSVIKKFMEIHDKEINAANVRNMPAPKGGSATQSITQEQFDKMNYREREKIFNEQPELYHKLTGKA